MKRIEEFIVELIKDDLMIHKLMLDAESLGLPPTNYDFHITDMIFFLLWFDKCEQCEDTYKNYVTKCKKKMKVLKAAEYKLLLRTATELYFILVASRSKGHDQTKNTDEGGSN